MHNNKDLQVTRTQPVSLQWSVSNMCHCSVIEITSYCKKQLPILVTERWARSWSQCTSSQPAGDCESSTRQ